MRKVQNQKDLKKNNLAMIFDYLKKHDVVVKSKLARELGLSVVTITKICDDLISAGIIEYTDERESTGGRKPLGLQLIRDSRFIIAIDLSEKDHAYIGLMNLGYEEISSDIIEIDPHWSIDEFFDVMKQRFNFIIDGIPEEKIIGVSISIPAIFNPYSGIIEECNNPVFINQNFKKRFGEIYSGKVIVDNDANLAALGHFFKNRVENLIYVHFTDGIGLGLILKGEIYRGYAGYAGELAYLGVPGFHGGICTVEHALSEDNLISCLESLTGAAEGALSIQDYRQEILNESENAELIVGYIKQTIGRLTALLIDLFNPEQVIFGGGKFDSFKNYLPDIIKISKEYSMTSKRITVEIKEASDDTVLVAKGCCERFYQEWIRSSSII